MKKMFTYVARYKLAVIVSLLLMGVELAVELIQPIIMGLIIDKGVVNGDLKFVTIWGAILLGMSVLAFAAGIISSFYSSKVSQGVGYDLREDMYNRIQSFSQTQMQAFTTSTLITRLTNDVTQFQGLVFAGLRIMLRAPLFVIGGMIMAFTVNVKLALILVITVPFLLAIMLWVMTKGVRLFQIVQVKLDQVNAIIRENLVGIRLVKAFYRGNYENKRFSKENTSLMDINKKALRLMELTMPIIMLGMNLSIVVILWFGAVEVNNGGALPGDLVAILNYGTRIMASFGVFTFLLMNFTRGRASALRMEEVLESEADEQLGTEQETTYRMKGAIQFNHVTFSYPNTTNKVLDDVSFSVSHGQTIGILGETGSGKSTLLQLIPRLYQVDDGRIWIDNQPIESYDQTYLRKHIGLVPQEAHLFSGSIKENILWGNEQATEEEIIQAIKDAQLDTYIESLPDKYETIIGQKGVNLSGGQKQRLSIARALVRNPSILMLDDSTSALDATTEVRVLEAIKRRNCTTVIVAEKISSVIHANQILLLQQGRLLASGDHDTLLKESETYREIYQSQMEKEGLIHGK